MVIASATILISSLVALSQDNLKRRLAFSTIGQLGYVVLGQPLPRIVGRVGQFFILPCMPVGKLLCSFVQVQSLWQPGKICQ